jgi:hypothetical protein
MSIRRRSISGALALALGISAAAAQPGGEAVSKEQRDTAITRGAEIILAMQEGPERAEWPYEGVYRVRGQIPIGYRVGGTAICATAVLLSPAYNDNPSRETVDAVRRAAEFVCASTEHPLMSPQYDGGYDVRGWGYTYGLDFLLKFRRIALAGKGQSDLAASVDRAIRFYIAAIEATRIPGPGGWNYARPASSMVAPPSPFMTGPTLIALFQAAADGFQVDHEVIHQALLSLTLAKMPSGAYVYSGAAGDRSRDGTPGAVGRMVAAESALHLAGRSSQADVRASIDAFLAHWQWLDQRRAQPGTHVPPYGVAPYYFYFAHYYAAQAIELLPARERPEYRRRLAELLFSVRQEDGSWNDRVFARSANYGTAIATMALMMPDLPPPARYTPPAPAAETPDPARQRETGSTPAAAGTDPTGPYSPSLTPSSSPQAPPGSAP